MEILTRSPLAEKAAAARARLDAHVRETVAWHFDPATGSPFWLERAAGLGFDPRKEVRGYEDLKLFGHFEDSWLRGGPVRRFIPKGLAGRPAYVFETGGSTGVPKSRVNIEDFQTDYELFSDTLSDAGFPPGVRLADAGADRPPPAAARGGAPGAAPGRHLLPRRSRPPLGQQADQERPAARARGVQGPRHRAGPDRSCEAHEIRCLFTTPKLLEALCEKVSLVKMGIRGIFCGGTEMNKQFHRFAREELVPGIDFVPTYGNTLMGLACHKPFDPAAPDYTITYYPPAPRAVFEIVDPADPERTVGYGETGRVMLTTLTRDFFMPRFLERDEGERAEPIDRYPWDGVSNLRLLSSLQESVVVGVY